MILHIVDDEKFLLQTITLFESTFARNNLFLVGTTRDSETFNDRSHLANLTQITFKRIETNSYLKEVSLRSKEASLIIFHNLYKEYKLKLIKNLDGSLKLAWVFWGAELYGLNPEIDNLLPLTYKAYYQNLQLKTYLKKKFFSPLKKLYYWQLLKSHLKTKLDYTLSSIDEDIDLLNTYTDNRSKRAWFSYYSFDKKVLCRNPSKEKMHILIGNSSSETNNHFDAFELLIDRDLSERKIYIPLNYGDVLYKETVIEKANSLFGAQSEPILDFLTLEAYSNLIDSCAVLIMNTRRQQAFNTIMMALANGCKVYLREENTIYPYLKRKGFFVFSLTTDLDGENALATLGQEEAHKNLSLVKNLYGHEVVLDRIKREISAILNE